MSTTEIYVTNHWVVSINESQNMNTLKVLLQPHVRAWYIWCDGFFCCWFRFWVFFFYWGTFNVLPILASFFSNSFLEIAVFSWCFRNLQNIVQCLNWEKRWEKESIIKLFSTEKAIKQSCSLHTASEIHDKTIQE